MNKDEQNIQRALDAISELEGRQKEIEDFIQSGYSGSEDESLSRAARMLDSIRGQAQRILDSGIQAKAECDRMARGLMEAAWGLERAEPEKSPSEVGGKVGEMGQTVVENAQNSGSVQAILEKSVDITGSLLKTSLDLADSVVSTTAKTASDILKVGGDAAKDIVDKSGQAAGSLIGQTANLANSLTSTVSNTLSGLFGSENQTQAQSASSNVLQPVGDMVKTTANLAQGILNTASASANSLLNSVGSIAQGLQGQGSDSSQKMVDAAMGLATSLVGEKAAGALKSALTGGQQSSGGVLGGLFNQAAQTAAQAINGGGNAIQTAANLVGNLASGMTNLGGTLLGEAAKAAGSLVQSGTKALTGSGQQGDSGGILGAVLGSANKILGSTSEAATSILSTAGDVGKGLFNSVGNLVNNVLGGEGGEGQGGLNVGSALKGITDFAGGAVKGAANLAGSVLGNASRLAGGLMDTASDIVGGVAKTAGNLVGGLLDGAVKGASSLVSGVAKGVGSLLGLGGKTGTEMNASNLATAWTSAAPQGVAGAVDIGKVSGEVGKKLDGLISGAAGNGGDGSGSGGGSGGGGGSASNPMGGGGGGLKTKQNDNDDTASGTRGIEITPPEKGFKMLMHDGDQQLLNPYSYDDGSWEIYSFRPSDAKQGWPRIAITPASFNSLSSLDTMLDMMPYVVVKEYFFKNTASMMIDFVKKIASKVKGASEGVKNITDPDSGGGEGKSVGEEVMKEISKVFVDDLEFKTAAIDIPYILYCCLRNKTFGNTYILPYIVSGSTIINSASNASEWGNGEGGASLLNALKSAIQTVTGAVGGLVLGATGSQAKIANLFPAPTWNGSGEDKVQFSFDLMLINDHPWMSRNNYMCVNTIIHNNRSLQKAIFATPGALYEIWLPTGQRHLMCTGDFKLYPLGLNRRVPQGFFSNGSMKIGSEVAAEMKSPHTESEVIPDGYKLSVTFQSCLANNLNTSVFQYYVDMDPYDSPSAEGSTSPGKTTDFGGAAAQALTSALSDSSNSEKTPGGAWSFARLVDDALADEGNEEVEKFEESTYNKRIGRLKSSLGDQAMDADSVVLAMRKAQRTVKDSSKFLSRLYNAPESSLWWRPSPSEEMYTTIQPDYRQTLRSKYKRGLGEVQSLDDQMTEERDAISALNVRLAETVELKDREPLLVEKVAHTRKLNLLERKRDEVVDDLVQTDVDLIQVAYDQQDSDVSLGKSGISANMLSQVWNEKILNSYEKERLQYLTSTEKERYFQEKVRALKKIDANGILNHPDWFFRVAVLDFIVQEIQRLVYWFKNCSWDDFDLIYRIVRKLNLLQLDVDAVVSQKEFHINRTNLFHISDEDMQGFDKIDGMLEGATLYELFQSQVVMQFEEVQENEEDEESTQQPDDEVKKEQESELERQKQRRVRQDIIVRVWGSESELTKAAYAKVKESQDVPLETPVEGYEEITTIGRLKNEIIKMKLNGIPEKDSADQIKLKRLLGALTVYVRTIKEALVMDEMSKMGVSASSTIGTKDEDINAPVS